MSKYGVGDAEDHGPSPFNEEIFEWDGLKFNVTAAKKLIRDRAFTTIICVMDFSNLIDEVEIDRKHALTVAMRVPVVIATVTLGGKETLLPIDGWHRLYKAKAMGQFEIAAHILTREETNSILEES